MRLADLLPLTKPENLAAYRACDIFNHGKIVLFSNL